MAIIELLFDELETAERKAWESLAGYKFQMFGYWAAIWVHLNRVTSEAMNAKPRPNPWGFIVATAKEYCKQRYNDDERG
jgi:hypothetical protein